MGVTGFQGFCKGQGPTSGGRYLAGSDKFRYPRYPHRRWRPAGSRHAESKTGSSVTPVGLQLQGRLGSVTPSEPLVTPRCPRSEQHDHDLPPSHEVAGRR